MSALPIDQLQCAAAMGTISKCCQSCCLRNSPYVPGGEEVLKPGSYFCRGYGVTEPDSGKTEKFGHGAENQPAVRGRNQKFCRSCFSKVHEGFIKHEKAVVAFAEPVECLDFFKRIKLSCGVAGVAEEEQVIAFGKLNSDPVTIEGKTIFGRKSQIVEFPAGQVKSVNVLRKGRRDKQGPTLSSGKESGNKVNQLGGTVGNCHIFCRQRMIISKSSAEGW